MRMLLITMLLGVGMLGCGDDTSAGGGDLGAVGQHDMAVHGDLAIAICADAGPKALGDACTTDCECGSAMCRPFQMGAVHLCTQPCTVATQAADCPAPSAGTCTNNGYCKF
jgi:hypothetical protein